MSRRCDFPGCRRPADYRLRPPWDGWGLCGECRTFRLLAFYLWVVSRGRRPAESERRPHL